MQIGKGLYRLAGYLAIAPFVPSCSHINLRFVLLQTEEETAVATSLDGVSCGNILVARKLEKAPVGRLPSELVSVAGLQLSSCLHMILLV